MTRPTPTQGAQSEAARVPRVSDEHLAYEHLRPWQGLKDADATDGLLLARDLRDERQASRDKDATIADLERRLAAAIEANNEWLETNTGYWMSRFEEADSRADALQARLTEAEQHAATAERRGFEAGLDAATTVATRLKDQSYVRYENGRGKWMFGPRLEWPCGDEIADAIRALAPAVPQEGETTP